MAVGNLITLGVGTPSNIPLLVLTGLSAQALPPPPDPVYPTADPAILIVLFEDYPTNSGVFSGTVALPTRCVQIEWMTSYNIAPAAAEVFLQGSIDGVVWNTLDTTTNVSGEIRQVNTAARFIRGLLGTTTAGTLVTVKAVAKFVKLGGI